MRFSLYNILSDKLPGGGYVLLNGLTGAFDLIDKELYTYIKNHNIIGENDFRMEDIEEYLERGFITEETIEEEIETAKRLIQEIGTIPQPYNVVIAPNMGCNYRCVYCFELGNKYFKNPCEHLMTRDDVDCVFQFMEKNDVKDRITLFGGEPLTKSTIDIIDYIVNEKNKDGKYNFIAVTNGHDLEYFHPYLGKGKIEELQITIDGPKPIHDKRRIALDKSSSFDKIMKNLRCLIGKSDVDIQVRVNVDMRNLLYLDELMQTFQKNGILSAENIYVYTSKVTGIETSDADECLMDETLTALRKSVPECYTSIEEERIRERFIWALATGSPVARASTYCGGHGKMLVFTPDHSIYSCWDCIGRDENIIGTYDNDGNIIWNDVEKDFLKKRSLEKNVTCVKCPYVLFCTGGCFRQAMEANLDYAPRQCKIYKTRFTKIMEEVIENWINEQLKKEEENNV